MLDGVSLTESIGDCDLRDRQARAIAQPFARVEGAESLTV